MLGVGRGLREVVRVSTLNPAYCLNLGFDMAQLVSGDQRLTEILSIIIKLSV